MLDLGSLKSISFNGQKLQQKKFWDFLEIAPYMECKELFTYVQLQNQRYKTELCKSAGVINYQAMPVNFDQHIQPYIHTINNLKL